MKRLCAVDYLLVSCYTYITFVRTETLRLNLLTFPRYGRAQLRSCLLSVTLEHVCVQSYSFYVDGSIFTFMKMSL